MWWLKSFMLLWKTLYKHFITLKVVYHYKQNIWKDKALMVLSSKWQLLAFTVGFPTRWIHSQIPLQVQLSKRQATLLQTTQKAFLSPDLRLFAQVWGIFVWWKIQTRIVWYSAQGQSSYCVKHRSSARLTTNNFGGDRVSRLGWWKMEVKKSLVSICLH